MENPYDPIKDNGNGLRNSIEKRREHRRTATAGAVPGAGGRFRTKKFVRKWDLGNPRY